MCVGLGQNKRVRVGKSSGPVLSHLWTKVHEILGQCRRSFVLSNAFSRLSTSRFVQQILAIKYPSCLYRTNVKNWPPFFSEGRPQLF